MNELIKKGNIIIGCTDDDNEVAYCDRCTLGDSPVCPAYHLTIFETYHYQIRDGQLYISVADNDNALLWPERLDGDWYGPASKCPYPYQEDLKASRRRLEDHIRKNPALLVECLQIAEKHGYPI